MTIQRKDSIGSTNSKTSGTSNDSSSIKFKVDPVNDFTLQNNYLTKFRLSTEEKHKKLKERKEKLKVLTNKLNSLKDKEKDDVFTEEKIKTTQHKNKLFSLKQNNSSKLFEEDTSSSSSDGELSDKVDSPKKEIKTLKVDVKKKYGEGNVLFKPSINLNGKPQQKEVLEVKNKILFESKKDSDDELSSVSSSISDLKENNKKLKKEIKEQEEKSSDSLDLEEEDEYEEYDDMEDEEGEEFDDLEDMEGEEFEDEELEFNMDQLKNLSPQQLSFFQNMFNPPDFKKDLLNKSPGEKPNEVDYKSLKEAIKNSVQNMKNLKSMKNEYNKDKSNNMLLGSKNKKVSFYEDGKKSGGNRSSDEGGKKEKTIKFNPNIKKVNVFDHKKVILLDSKYPRDFKLNTIQPGKSCLKKS